MNTNPILLSDHLLEALDAVRLARKAMKSERVIHREAVLAELARVEVALSRIVGLIAGYPEA
jgi:predicted transcriptional regulator